MSFFSVDEIFYVELEYTGVASFSFCIASEWALTIFETNTSFLQHFSNDVDKHDGKH